MIGKTKYTFQVKIKYHRAIVTALKNQTFIIIGWFVSKVLKLRVKTLKSMSPVSPVFHANILHCRTSEVDPYSNSHILLSLDLKKYIEIFVITNVRLNYIKYGIVFKMGSHLISLVGASIRCFHRVAIPQRRFVMCNMCKWWPKYRP